jgi:4-hydroxy-tetrahydrodipicolinate reductase
MDIVICGDGRLGWAIATTAHDHGHRARVLGRPGSQHHDPANFARADVVVDASRAEAVPANLAAAIEAGVRRFVVATTGWSGAADDVRSLLERRGAAAVVAPNLSLGAAVFLDLVESAAAAFANLDGFEPFIWEWHRRGKADRPSGTARELARRIAAADPSAGDVEISAVRAGASPGTHLVGFDAAGETIELRLTARDRTSYAAGALASADWLLREARRPGVHGFDAVVTDLLHPVPLAATA